MSHICGIYKIEHVNSKRIYVGQSHDIEKRIKQHINNKKPTQYIDRFIAKHKNEDFEISIIETCKPEELNEKEIYWINYYDCYIGRTSSKNAKGFNLTRGGDASRIVFTPDEQDGIVYLYKEGLTVSDIAEKYEVSSSIIKRYLEDKGMEVRSNQEQRNAKKAYNDKHIWESFMTDCSTLESLRAKFKLSENHIVKTMCRSKPENLSKNDLLKIFISLGISSSIVEKYVY